MWVLITSVFAGICLSVLAVLVKGLIKIQEYENINQED